MALTTIPLGVQKKNVFPLTRPILFKHPTFYFLKIKMQNKKKKKKKKRVKHRSSTTYLYFHKITGPTLFFSGEK